MNCSVCEEHKYACRINDNYDIVCCDCNEIMKKMAAFLKIPRNEVHRSSNIEQDLVNDSLHAVELLLDIEDRFDLVIPESKLNNIKTVQDIINIVKGALS